MYTDEQRVRAYVQDRKTGATCDEVEIITGIPHQTASARLHDLEHAGIVIRSGKFRKTRWGGTAEVYQSMEQ